MAILHACFFRVSETSFQGKEARLHVLFLAETMSEEPWPMCLASVSVAGLSGFLVAMSVHRIEIKQLQGLLVEVFLSPRGACCDNHNISHRSTENAAPVQQSVKTYVF